MAFRVLLIAAISLLTAPGPAPAQSPGIPKIGILIQASPETNPHYYKAFREGLREHGLIEGKNIGLEWRFAHSKYERLPELAKELVKLKVDVIVTNGTPPTRAAIQATTTIPIVLAVVGGDPVAEGWAKSLSRPGGNVTGLSLAVTDVSAKQLDLLRKVSPKLTRIAIFTNPDNA